MREAVLSSRFSVLSRPELRPTREARRHGGGSSGESLASGVSPRDRLVALRFVRGRFQPQHPSETVDDADPFAGVRSPKRRGPQSQSGAVARVEPVDEENPQSLDDSESPCLCASVVDVLLFAQIDVFLL